MLSKRTKSSVFRAGTQITSKKKENQETAV